MKLLDGVPAGLPEYGTRLVVVGALPQVSELANSAPDPVSNWSLKSLNGTSGVLLNTAVSWPVEVLAVTVPVRRTSTPSLLLAAST